MDFAGVEQTLNAKFKPKQEALSKCVIGDTLCVLPTGYGKSLIIKALPHITSSVVIVVSTLNCILDQQEKDFGPNVIRIPMEELADEKMLEKLLLKPQVTHILGHPEQLTSNSFKKALMSHMGNRISHILADEAHVILSWCKTDFRPAFSKLSTLCAVFPGAIMVALTATASATARKEISSILGMKHYQEILRSPDRSNILLSVVKEKGCSWTSDAVDAVIDPLLIQLKNEQLQFDRTIIYAPLKWCGYVHERAVSKHKLPDNILIGQYHAPQTEQMKSSIGEDLKNTQGQIRLLLATKAYGMGTDCSNIHRVIHLGPPISIETLAAMLFNGPEPFEQTLESSSPRSFW